MSGINATLYVAGTTQCLPVTMLFTTELPVTSIRFNPQPRLTNQHKNCEQYLLIFPQDTNEALATEHSDVMYVIGSEAIHYDINAGSQQARTQYRQPQFVEAATIRVSQQLQGVQRQLTLPDGTMISFDDNDAFETWYRDTVFMYPRSIESGVTKLEKSGFSVILALLLVPLSLFGIFKYAIPAFAVTFASLVPNEVTQFASQQTLYSLDESVLDASNLPLEQQEQYLRYWHEMIVQLQLDPNTFNIQFRDSEVFGANAFALPDGTMVITDDLVELVGEDIDLLTAILLHEIGHVQQHHSMRLIAEAIATSLVIQFVLGDTSGLIELFGGISNSVAQNQFSQHMEWEADNYALANLDAVGLDKMHFVAALETLASMSDGSTTSAAENSHEHDKELGDSMTNANSKLATLLSSHPGIWQRIAHARQYQHQ